MVEFEWVFWPLEDTGGKTMQENHKNALIIGGSSGLGLELATTLPAKYHTIVTGRHDPKNEKVDFRVLDLNTRDQLAGTLDEFVANLPRIDLLIYAAGFYQEGTISDVSDDDIAAMTGVGLLAPAMLLQRLLKKQSELPGFIAVTSTSQWTPRLLEPMYTSVKAGLGMLANSVSLDERIDKVLVAAPAGMNTRFWENSPRDASTMLDPKWVAEQILEQYSDNFKYKFTRILREPERVEIVETR